jgi:hypothetical protein
MLHFALLDPLPGFPKLPGNLDPLMDATGYSFDKRRDGVEVPKREARQTVLLRSKQM